MNVWDFAAQQPVAAIALSVLASGTLITVLVLVGLSVAEVRGWWKR